MHVSQWCGTDKLLVNTMGADVGVHGMVEPQRLRSEPANLNTTRNINRSCGLVKPFISFLQVLTSNGKKRELFS